jgi:hypothetical protein
MNYFKILCYCQLGALFIALVVYLAMSMYFVTFNLHYWSAFAKFSLGLFWCFMASMSFLIAAWINKEL